MLPVRFRSNYNNTIYCTLVLFYGFMVVFNGGECRKQAPPIGAEETRKSNKAAECQLGKEVRELGSTWFADLGPPFGVMYCIKCQCVPVQKKRRVIGKVHCRNIKHECPKPSCDEPILHPGRCCKVCPSDLNSPDVITDIATLPQPAEEDDKNYKYYASVMTGASDVATGRYSFHKKSLYFSFFASSRPYSIQFLDTSGNILEEQDLGSGSVYQNATDKICGVWRRIPREYRRMIREEKLVASLLWPDKRNVTGQIYRYRTLSTEMYTALLQGRSDMPGSGGTAIVSVSTTAPSIHILAVVTGLFTKQDANDVPLSFLLHTRDGNTVVIDEIVRVEKASPELNIVELSAAVTSSELRMLSRGKLRLSISSRNNGGGVKVLEGIVGPRAVCETFQALLTHQAQGDNSAGLAWLYVGREGKLHYHVRIERVSRPVIIGLVTERRLLELEDLSPGLTSNGWTNGTLDAPAAKHLELLYSGELGVNVATKSSSSVIRGRLAPRFTASPVDSPAPLLLSSPGTSLSAIAWIDVDIECNLHYEVEMSEQGTEYSLYLSQVPMEVPGAPINRRFLESGGQSGRMEGSLLGLLPHELLSLQAGVVHLELQPTHHHQPLLRARWPQVIMPETCLPQPTDNELHFRSDAAVHDVNGETASPCYHGDRFHEDGSQWRSVQDHCTVCHCSNGRVGCEPVVCAPIPSTCELVLPPTGQLCCPTCSNLTQLEVVPHDEMRGCHMAGQYFAPGSMWHPYLPPNGFDTCTLCSCHAVTLKVTCPRVDCPPLDCDERVSVRPDKRACCRVCPSSLPQPSQRPPSSRESLREEEATDEQIAEEILATGGCKYPVGGPYRNGQEWHPRLYSHGELKCVKCRCKDGKVKCERKRCNKWSCNDECCAAQCKRRRRNIRRHH